MANLYTLASSDLKLILEDSATGFGVPMTLTSPDGETQEITGMASDIGLTLDPETGQNISARTAHVTLPTAALTIGRPKGVPDVLMQPWLVEFQLPGESSPVKFKINESMPDRLGCIVCFIELWEDAI